MASDSATKPRADLTTRWNSGTLTTIWSLGVTTMLALGSTDFIFQLTYAMQGAVLRRHGSRRTLPTGMSGSCSYTLSAYLADVTTHTFSTGTMPPKRSYVNCRSVLPHPITSTNCLGLSCVLMGQKRVPAPSAMMTK